MKQPDTELGRIDAGTSPRRLTTILVADICGYSRMSERDEAEAIRIADLLCKMFETTTQNHGGRVFSRIADGFLAEFPSARSGMQAALDYAKDVKARNNLAPNAIDADIRAGIHVGDVTDRPDGNILGHGVNVAARLQEMAEPGTILASSNIMNLLGHEYQSKGIKRSNLALKNISEPVTAYQIDPQNRSFFHHLIKRNKQALKYTIASLIIIVTLAMVFIQYGIGKNDQNQINPEAVTATLYNLKQTPYPISDMFVALNKTNSFDGALNLLNKKFEESDLPDKDKVDLLHQIAALAVNRNSPEAEKAYRKILSVKEDPEAFLQLARILYSRGDIVQARDFLQRAKSATNNISYMRERLLLGIKIETALMDGRHGPTGNSRKVGSAEESIDAEQRLSEIVVSQEARAHHDLRLRAKYYAHMLQFMRVFQADDGSPNEKETAIYVRIIQDLKSLIEEQQKFGFLYDLSEAYATLSLAQNSVGLYKDSIFSLEQSLDIEKRLARPSKTMAAHANLAYVNVALHNEYENRLDQAEHHVKRVREIAKAENRANREYYNLYILALIADKRGDQDKACSYFDSSRGLWPKASLSEGFLPDLDKDLGCNFYKID